MLAPSDTSAVIPLVSCLLAGPAGRRAVAGPQLRAAGVPQPEEVRPVFDLLRAAAEAGDAPPPDGVAEVMERVELYPKFEHVLEQIADYTADLDRLARRLPAGSRAWALVVRLLGWVGSADATACWLSHFLADRPGVEREAYQTAGGIPVSHPDLLFPRLLDLLPDPRRRAVVIDLATGLTRPPGERVGAGHYHFASHPLADRLDLLREMLGGPAATEPGDAFVAVRALGQIDRPDAVAALRDALAHPDEWVRQDAAYQLARRGDPAGVEALAEDLLCPIRWHDAQRKFEALAMSPPARYRGPWAAAGERVGESALDRLLRSDKRIILGWMAGRRRMLPRGFEVVDRRDLRWPPDAPPCRACVIRRRIPVGPDTWGPAVLYATEGTTCLGVGPEYLSAEDHYSQLLADQLGRDRELRVRYAVDAELTRRDDALFDTWTGPPLTQFMLLAVAEPGPSLGYPCRRVGVAAARMGGVDGWAVLDGPGSVWRPADRRLPITTYYDVLVSHVGRHLLGFPPAPRGW